MTNKIYIGIGSNIDRHKNIQSCISKLALKYKNLTLSPTYETESMGFEGPNFYNLVCCFETQHDVFQLQEEIKKIEKDHGRNFHETKFSSRTLDIDILYFNDSIIIDEKIKIPRKEILEYDFVLKPLIDIAPEFVHPELNITNLQIFKEYTIKKLIITKIELGIKI